MKSTKINHTRAAVIINDNGATEGIIYDTPPNTKGEKSICSRLHDANMQAQNLYSLFNMASKFSFIKNKNEEKFCTDVSKKCNKIINGILKKNIGILEQKKYFANLPEQTIRINKSKIKVKEVYPYPKLANADKGRDLDLIHKMVEGNLRKAFCHKVVKDEKEIDIPNVVEKLVIYIYHMGKNRDEHEKITDEEMTAFLNILNKDYFKKEQLENTEISIKRQNVKSQKFDTHGEKICLSNANHAKKKYLFEFLKQIVSVGLEETGDKYIKKLIVLFFYGQYEYDKIKDADISGWGFGKTIYNTDIEFSLQISQYVMDKFKTKDKKLRRKINDEIKAELSRELKERFKAAAEKLSVNDEKTFNMDKYWLRFISDKTEKLLLEKYSVDKERKRKLGYLCEYVWNEWVAFVCGKFIDLGKGVYHFVMPDVRSLESDVCFGNLLAEYKDGITSFDYERIQAEENLDRDVSVYISFAINNFGRAVCTDAVREKDEDVLTMELNDKKIASNAVKKIFQYFGGQRRLSNKVKTKELVLALKEEIANVRNCSFHYTGKIEKRDERTIVLEIFKKEYGRLSEVYRKKYHSNGVPMFYAVENIDKLMDKLYGGARPRIPQVPSFQRIVKRDDLPEFIIKEDTKIINV